MGEHRNRFLFELLPYLFPEPYLTPLEVELWVMHGNSKPRK